MTNQSEQDRILTRVAKMLKLANADSGATEGERDNALRMAHATLAKYNLDISQAEAISDRVQTGPVVEPRERGEGVYLGMLWARQIAAATAKLFFCYYYYSKVPRNQHKARHTFIGKHSNVVTAQLMAKYLIQSVHREAQAYQNTVCGDYSCYRSFATAAMVKIYGRCEALRKESVAPQPEAAPGMSLAVVYDTEEKANLAFVSGIKLTVRKQANKGRYNSEAASAGAAFGSRVSLNRQLS